MCIGSLTYGPLSSSSSSSSSSLRRSWPSRRHLRLGLLKRKLNEAKQRKLQREEFELKNLKLYMENQTIIEENEKLRKKAMLLHKENQALFSQLQKKLSEKSWQQQKQSPADTV
ncbi:protein LITTLE ZIPPER 2-like [Prosopis cineraria]|uniref:protein LITTLE ZIPPER 2-like n=1 Tax=Prosopis cineraria TaxID=364024 RepID=UPI00240FD066|nr:protein LITTLE ZIPPER 2-like [Prosopis cineraria]